MMVILSQMMAVTLFVKYSHIIRVFPMLQALQSVQLYHWQLLTLLSSKHQDKTVYT